MNSGKKNIDRKHQKYILVEFKLIYLATSDKPKQHSFRAFTFVAHDLEVQRLY